VQGVSGIKQLGILHLGDSYTDLTFRSEKMFKSKRDALVRQVDFEAEVMDFFDFTSIWEKQEKVASTSMAVTVAGVVGTRMVGGVGWLDGALTATKLMGSSNMRRLIIPGILLTGKFAIHPMFFDTNTNTPPPSHPRRQLHPLPNPTLPAPPPLRQTLRPARRHRLHALERHADLDRSAPRAQIPRRQTARRLAAECRKFAGTA
jgi:hypothetical protein